ncbi:MobF family relaxase [Georgenia thermotolerans]|uniref:AAA family ATPase n=1 Tax=Georgenia thermotolerans TaxID=527326 RepID=A0A7J5UQJ7_9MICO|nr:MobF family relaxase [Georgenia thermotolerans]KAE8764682.1 AAA family ATPase [Georgenia thermotolerans]
MRGGVILFRGTGTAARRYLEADRSRADEYYLEAGTARAAFSVVDGAGMAVDDRALTPTEYAGWVDWLDPISGEAMGRARQAGGGRQGSPRFAEMVVNTPKSLSIAAALHPDVSAALDAAQRDAAQAIRSWLGQHSVTRVGPRGNQEVVPVERLQTVAISHRTSRAGDPHRHIHLQIGTRVWARGAWRGLDTAALFRQQGAIRALGAAVLAAHPQLAAVLGAHGLTLDPVSGEVAELEPFNAVMSKRAGQVARNLAAFTAQWEAAHPGREPGPGVSARLQAMAWDHHRPSKKPSRLGSEAGWRRELDEAGYTPDLRRVPCRPPRELDELRVQQVANRALDRCAAAASTWTRHTVQEHVTRIITESGVRATPAALVELITITTRLAVEDCLSVLPPGAAAPDHVAHLTSLRVVAVETRLRDLLAARAGGDAPPTPDMIPGAQGHVLDAEQARAAAAIASDAALVVVEGAAGAGKTTMLGAAIRAATEQGRATRIVTPTKKAAQVAAQELGVPADSVAKLVHANGWRWNADAVWTRLKVGDADPDTGTAYGGPPPAARLRRSERIMVDEAGMLDQDTALALLTIADEAGATLALVGDRAQLPAVGRGGVLDIAAQLAGTTYDMANVHRFTDPAYADLTVRMRAGEHPAELFDQLHALGLVRVHESTEAMREAIARTASGGDAITTATNEEARELNARIREVRVRQGLVDDARTVSGADGLPIGTGDVIQTRHNDSVLKVANRQTWTVTRVERNGAAWVTEHGSGSGRRHPAAVRLPAQYVAEHAHLAYAATAYGVQGATVDQSHTVLSDALDAAGVYVGMTRGRTQNLLHVVAADLDDARQQFVAALERDRADRGLTEATRAAQDAVSGLVPDGRLAWVNAERTRLREWIATADRQAARWERAKDALARQAAAHHTEYARQSQFVVAADAHASEVRNQVAVPLIVKAIADAANYQTAQQRMWQANRALPGYGRFGRRSAARTARETTQAHQDAEDAMRRRWGAVPPAMVNTRSWAEAIAGRRADAHSRVVEAREDAAHAHRQLRGLTARHADARAALWRSIGDGQPPSTIDARAVELRRRADQARRLLAAIEALPITEAAQLLRQNAIPSAPERMPDATLKAQALEAHGQTSPPPARRLGPRRDLGPWPPSSGSSASTWTTRACST